MDELSMVSWGLFAKTLSFVIAAISVHYMLRYWDKRNHIDWGKNYDAFDESPQALAIYFGARVVAISLLASAIYG